MRARSFTLSLVLCFIFWFGHLSASDSTSSSRTEHASSEDTTTTNNGIRFQDRYEIGTSVYARALAVEHNKNSLWVGTSVGVLEIDLNNHSIRNTFTREHGLANEYVFAIGIDQTGYKWFGTNAGGMSRYRDGEWKTWFPMHGLADYWIYSFAWQPDGTQWIGTWAGVNSLHPVSGEIKTYVSELINEWVYGIAVDSKNRVWFGTEGGISRFDSKQWESWDHADGLGAENSEQKPFSKNTGLGTRNRHDLGLLSGGEATYNPNYVFTVLIDQQDNLWAGTWGGGLSRFDGETWTNYTVEDGLAGNIVYSIAQEPSGVLWIGTNNGLSRFDGERWTKYGRNDGFVDLNVYSVAIAPDGNVWAGTKGAVLRLGTNKSDG
ncbi:MAG: two-component regulator propeller domain-containing protein [Candidatus Thiodiazotropha sp. (ex. Lucinoma kazani)]